MKMRYFLRFLLVAATSGWLAISCAQAATEVASMPAQSAASETRPFTVVDIKVADGQLAEQIREQVERAKAAHLTPYLQLTADWSSPCRRLRAAMNDPAMVWAFRGTYIIRVNERVWSKSLAAAGFGSGLPVPAFFALNTDGRPTGRSIDGGAWDDEFPTTMAPPLKRFFSVTPWKFS